MLLEQVYSVLTPAKHELIFLGSQRKQNLSKFSIRHCQPFMSLLRRWSNRQGPSHDILMHLENSGSQTRLWDGI